MPLLTGLVLDYITCDFSHVKEMIMRWVLLGFAAVLGLSGSAAAADPVAAALEADDPMAVEALLSKPSGLSAAQVELLNGAAAAMRFDDKAAIEALTRAVAVNGMPPAVKRSALSLLGGVQLRANNYAAAAQALDAALAVADPAQSESDRHSQQQTRDVAFALRGEVGQTHEPLREGRAAIKRDMADLARAMGQLNGETQEFILDTGAGFSTITRSVAARLKLRMLPDQITVGSVTAKAVPAQLGIAERVEIAGNVFHNVVFLVMADEALTFGGGVYKIEAILGFPVMARMGRIEFAKLPEGEVFRVGVPSTPLAGNVRDLYLNVLRPMTIVDVAGAGRVRMLLDSGARRSSLNETFANAFPALVQNVPSEKSTIGGAGGMKTIDVRVLKNVTVVADGRPRRAESVSVTSEKKGEHGALGQDVLRAEGGFALDFNTMDFVFLPAR
jgi:predicted aspartyl protease